MTGGHENVSLNILTRVASKCYKLNYTFLLLVQFFCYVGQPTASDTKFCFIIQGPNLFCFFNVAR